MVTRRAVASEFRVRIPALSFFLVNDNIKKQQWKESSRCGLFSGGVPFLPFFIFYFFTFYLFFIFHFFSFLSFYFFIFVFYFFIFYFFYFFKIF